MPALLLAAPGFAQTRLASPAALRAPVPSPGAGAPTAALLAPGHVPAALAPLPSPAASISAAAPVPAPAPAAARASGVQLLLDLGRTPEESEAARVFAGVFDGARAPVEGSPVTPRFERERNPLPLPAAVVRDAVAKVLPALRESVALGSWSGPHTTLDQSCCGDAAPKLAALLRARGVPARLIEAEAHFYVLIESPDVQLFIDPTIRQFFGKRAAPRGVPEVFVGTLPELAEFFERHGKSKTARDGLLRIYFADSAVREERLRELEAEILLGGRRDLEPLRREMGLPPRPVR